jgi:hypothetical protein
MEVAEKKLGIYIYSHITWQQEETCIYSQIIEEQEIFSHFTLLFNDLTVYLDIVSRFQLPFNVLAVDFDVFSCFPLLQ